MPTTPIPWQEVLNPQLTAYWNGTHQGRECVPPTRMWHAPLSPCVELWVMFWDENRYEPIMRWRSISSGWWYASKMGSDPWCEPSLAQAQAVALARIQQHVPPEILKSLPYVE